MENDMIEKYFNILTMIDSSIILQTQMDLRSVLAEPSWKSCLDLSVCLYLPFMCKDEPRQVASEPGGVENQD